MEIERETLLEIVAAVVPVLAMIGVIVFIGASYTDAGTFTGTGGGAIVAAIVGFVFVMTAVGIWLSRVKNPEGGRETAGDGGHPDDGN